MSIQDELKYIFMGDPMPEENPLQFGDLPETPVVEVPESWTVTVTATDQGNSVQCRVLFVSEVSGDEIGLNLRLGDWLRLLKQLQEVEEAMAARLDPPGDDDIYF